MASSAALPTMAQWATPRLTPQELGAKVKGIEAGIAPTKSPLAYIFFDAQCPHCGTMWANAKPLAARARLIWVPVAVLSQKSVGQGAALLSATNPTRAMDEHEASLLARKGGISDKGLAPGAGEQMRRNTETFHSFKATGVPFVMAWPDATKAPVTHTGAMATADLAKLLGLPA